MSLFLRNNLDVLVVSCGGAGTTLLIKSLKPYLRVNHPRDIDLCKHMPVPPLRLYGPTVKVIYVFDDPVTMLTSLFRRKYHPLQAIKLQEYYFPKSPVARSETLTDYLQTGKDRFFFERHWQNWHDEFLMYPSLFLRYQAIPDSLDRIRDFLNLPQDFVDGFPEWKARNPPPNPLSPEETTRLESLYASFRKRLEKQPDVEILNPPPVFPRCLSWIPRYLIAVLVEIHRVVKGYFS